MKKATIVVIILLVIGVIAGCIFISFNSANISYVADYETSTSDSSKYVMHRLYSSNIDETKMQELASNVHLTSFTDEDIAKAALLAGTPQFYPQFYFSMIPAGNSDEYSLTISGRVNQGMAEGQAATNLAIKNLTTEVAATGFTIDNTSYFRDFIELTGNTEYTPPVISADGVNLAAFTDGACTFAIRLKGNSGRITLEFTYDIISDLTFFDRMVLEDQLAVINIDITKDADGDFIYNFTHDAVSQVSDKY